MSGEWIRVCRTDEIDFEDLVRFDHNGRTYCIYSIEIGYFATDGLCTHESHHLEDGLVIGNVIECPIHNGRFDVTSGKALSPPVCVDLVTYPVEVRGGAVWMKI